MELFPVLTAGLHCGYIEVGEGSADQYLFPVLTAGLHCGHSDRFKRVHEHAVSSRS